MRSGTLAAERIFATIGLRVFDVEQLSTHGGSLRLFACRTSSARQRTARVDEVLDMEWMVGLHTDPPYRAFAEQVRENQALAARTADRAEASIVGYGAAAKGNTPLNYCGIGADMLDFVLDRSPHKQGMFLPGTRLEVRAPPAIDRHEPDYVLILPWSLRDEVTAQLAHIAAWGGRFIVPIPNARIIGDEALFAISPAGATAARGLAARSPRASA